MNIKKIKFLMIFFCIGNELSGLFNEDRSQQMNPYFSQHRYTDSHKIREELENAKKELKNAKQKLTEYELKDQKLAEAAAQIPQIRIELFEMPLLLMRFEDTVDQESKKKIKNAEKNAEKNLETAKTEKDRDLILDKLKKIRLEIMGEKIINRLRKTKREYDEAKTDEEKMRAGFKLLRELSAEFDDKDVKSILTKQLVEEFGLPNSAVFLVKMLEKHKKAKEKYIEAEKEYDKTKEVEEKNDKLIETAQAGYEILLLREQAGYEIAECQIFPIFSISEILDFSEMLKIREIREKAKLLLSKRCSEAEEKLQQISLLLFPPEAVAGPGIGSEPGAGAGARLGSEPGAGAWPTLGPGLGTEPRSGLESGAGAGAGAGPTLGPGAGSEPGIGSGAGAEAGSESGTGTRLEPQLPPPPFSPTSSLKNQEELEKPPLDAKENSLPPVETKKNPDDKNKNHTLDKSLNKTRNDRSFFSSILSFFSNAFEILKSLFKKFIWI